MDGKTKTKNRNIADALDWFILRIGHVFCWANAILLAFIVIQVILRYGFSHGLIMLQELQWHLYSMAFMLGLSYAMVTNSHVRIDLFHGGFHKKTQEWIEIIAILFLLFPFISLVCWHTIYFMTDSWVHNERSLNPMGLPYRWIIKAFIPIGFILLALSAVSRLIRAVHYLTK